ncbi:MAG: hypothetical protein JO099_01330 [Acidobacteriia bacterium]|nr:hypothetical protein [Terriglobia bacterium]
MHPVRNAPGNMDRQLTMRAIADSSRPAFKPETPGAGGFDLPGILVKYRYLSIGVFLLALAAGLGIIALRNRPYYYAETTIYVSPSYFKDFREEREHLQVSYSTLVSQQILTIYRYDILSEAVRRMEEQGIHWRKADETEEAAVNRLLKLLEVRRIPDSYEIAVGITTTRQNWAAPIVNTVAEVFLEKGKGEDFYDRAKRLEVLRGEKASLEKELQQRLDEEAGFPAEVFEFTADKKGVVDDRTATAARDALAEARRKRADAEAQLAALQNGDIRKSQGAINADSSMAGLFANLMQRRLDLRTQLQELQIDGVLPAHPKYQRSEKALAEVNEQLKHLQEEANAGAIDKLKTEVARLRRAEDELNQEWSRQTSKAAVATKNLARALDVKEDIDRVRTHLTTVQSRIDNLTSEGDSPGFLRIFSLAKMPLEPIKSTFSKRLALMAAFAFFLSVAVPVGLDQMDQRILGPRDVERVLGFRPLGMMIQSDATTKEFAQEYFRRLIHSIDRTIVKQGSKSIVFTPVAESGAARMLVSEIGRSLVAQGLKTVIIDANPVAAVPRDEEAKPVTPVEILKSGVPVGKAAPNGGPSWLARIELTTAQGLRRIPEIGRVGSVIENLGHEYDVILISAPPIEFSADSEALAAACDVNLMVVEAGKATRRDLTGAARILERVAGGGVGAVLIQISLDKADTALRKEYKRYAAIHAGSSRGPNS